MRRTNVVRRAGRLLGAVTVTGVMSAVMLAASPVAAHADTGDKGYSPKPANGLSITCANGLRMHNWEANGL